MSKSKFTQDSSKAVVLVVEDEPLLLLIAVEIVEDAGYEALTADNADAAVELLCDRPDVSIVFTDVDMPGSMNGLRLAATIRDRWPPIKVIITSGEVARHASEIPARDVFIAKPYQPEHFASLLDRMAA